MRTVRPPIRVVVGVETTADRDAVTAILAAEGLDVLVAGDAREVERAAEDAGVGLLVVDPDLFGADAFIRLRRLLERHARISLFLFASAPVLEAAMQFLGDRAVEFLRKPLVREDFVDALDRRVVHPSSEHIHEKEALAKIGDVVHRLREQRASTRKDLAQLAGLSPSLISQLERGETSPSIASLVRLARALGVPLKTFFEDC